MAGEIGSWFVSLGVKGAEGVKNALKDLKGGLGDLGNVAGVARGALAALGVGVSVKALWSLTEMGAKSLEVADSFRFLARQAGQSSEDILAQLKRASGGTIAETDLVLGANRAMMLGLKSDAQSMADLMEVARFRARAMGLDTTQAFDNIVTGLGRMSPLILDNLGLIIDQKAANEAYAESIGKTADALTTAEEKFALQAAAIKVGKDQIREAGGIADNAADSFRRMEAATKDLKTSMGEISVGAFGGAIETAAGWMGTLAERTYVFGMAWAMIKGAGAVFEADMHNLRVLLTGQGEFIDKASAYQAAVFRAADANGILASSFNWAAAGADTASGAVQTLTAKVNDLGAANRANLATGMHPLARRLPGDPGYEEMVAWLTLYYDDKDAKRKEDEKKEKEAAKEAQRAWEKAYDDIKGFARGAMGSLTFNFDYASIMDQLGFHQDTWDEEARRAMDVVNKGEKSPWYQAMLDKGQLTPERLAQFGGDPKAAAASWIHEFEMGMHPDAIDMSAASKNMYEGITKKENWEGLWGGLATTWQNQLKQEEDAVKGVGKASMYLMMMGMAAGVKENTSILQLMAEAVSPLVWKYIQDRQVRTGAIP